MQHSSLVKTENGFTFRDLNKNGKLDIYEDPRQPAGAQFGTRFHPDRLPGGKSC